MNTYKKIEIGDKYGYWIVKGYAGKRGSRNKDYWNCECKCGCNKDVLGETLKNGRSSSCGCMQKEMARGKGIEKREIFLKPGDKFGNWIVLNFMGKIHMMKISQQIHIYANVIVLGILEKYYMLHI